MTDGMATSAADSSITAFGRKVSPARRKPPPGVKASGAPQLVISFWHIGLENLPEGRFRHQSLSGVEAKGLIDSARKARTLHGASHDDMLAPYHKRERKNHERLCRVLGEHYDIKLTLEDFVVKFEDEGRKHHSIRPLQLVQVDGSSRFLVVSCHYTMAERRRRGQLEFDIAPDSVSFHLFESIGSKGSASRPVSRSRSAPLAQRRG